MLNEFIKIYVSLYIVWNLCFIILKWLLISFCEVYFGYEKVVYSKVKNIMEN